MSAESAKDQHFHSLLKMTPWAVHPPHYCRGSALSATPILRLT